MLEGRILTKSILAFFLTAWCSFPVEPEASIDWKDPKVRVDGFAISDSIKLAKKMGWCEGTLRTKNDATFVGVEDGFVTEVSGTTLDVGASRVRSGIWSRSDLLEVFGHPHFWKMEHAREIWTYAAPSKLRPKRFLHIRSEEFFGMLYVCDFSLTSKQEL